MFPSVLCGEYLSNENLLVTHLAPTSKSTRQATVLIIQFPRFFQVSHKFKNIRSVGWIEFPSPLHDCFESVSDDDDVVVIVGTNCCCCVVVIAIAVDRRPCVVVRLTGCNSGTKNGRHSCQGKAKNVAKCKDINCFIQISTHVHFGCISLHLEI